LLNIYGNWFIKEIYKQDEMKSAIKIILIFVFLLFAGKGFSQTAVQSGDTLRIRQQQMEQQKEQQKEQERLHQGEQQGQSQAARANAPGQANGNKQNKAVKQVRGSRPDMSKAKGARPPMIVRPSGSGVPKGVGKPGGAGRKGGR
jgi:Sec-independent protein translocase protein TatA